MKGFRFPIRVKLTIALLVPLVAAILVCSLAGVSIINSRVLSQAQDKVRTDLNTAREIYNHEVIHVRDAVRYSAGTPHVVQAIAAGNRTALDTILNQSRTREHLDILTAVDSHGRVLCRTRNSSVAGDNQSQDAVVQQALRGEVVSGTQVLNRNRLRIEGDDLASQATISLVPTQRARETRRLVAESGMVLVAAAPVIGDDGRVTGAVYGGVLLNGNNSLVDKITHTVFDSEPGTGEEIGAATIFLDDVRIATNVPTSGGERAIGTRLSEEVYQRVNVLGEKWVGRAFVVNGWYFAAYEPIRDVNGQIAGSLYVGLREEPYLLFKDRVLLIFAAVLLFGSITGLAVSGLLGKQLARPIRDLQNLVQRFAAGERTLQIPVVSEDEIGDLARDFNHMTTMLIKGEEDVRELNRSLEHKVLERTNELEEKNRILLQTRQELVKAEKLAGIGELAAGVAHEINNPMAVIRGNAELLRFAISADNPSREEVEAIMQQVGRVEKIVGNLLAFARQKEKRLEDVQIPSLLDEVVKQVGFQASMSKITLCREYADKLPPIQADRDQLHQVFTNLVLNAVQAVGGAGTVTLAARGHDGEWCEVTVADSGGGIDHSSINHVFDPFYTTKSTGTGLGLSVSYGIVKDHGGRITVSSAPGTGTKFTVILPIKQQKPRALPAHDTPAIARSAGELFLEHHPIDGTMA